MMPPEHENKAVQHALQAHNDLKELANRPEFQLFIQAQMQIAHDQGMQILEDSSITPEQREVIRIRRLERLAIINWVPTAIEGHLSTLAKAGVKPGDSVEIGVG